MQNGLKDHAFKLWCWKRRLRVPWTARSINPKGNQPEYSLAGLMVKLKLQYFGHLTQRANSLEKILMLEKIEGSRRRGRQWAGWHQWLNGHDFEQAPGDSEGQGSLHAAVHGVTKSQTGLSDWKQQPDSRLKSWNETSLRPLCPCICVFVFGYHCPINL